MIETIKHRGLRRLYQKNDRSGIRADRRGVHAVTVKANWRMTFRFHDGAAHDVNLEELPLSPQGARTVPMKSPNHPADIIRDCLDELGVNITDAAEALGVTRASLSRVINHRAGVSPEMAVRLEKAIGSTAGFWLRLQMNYDLARIQARSGKIHARRLSTPAQLAS